MGRLPLAPEDRRLSLYVGIPMKLARQIHEEIPIENYLKWGIQLNEFLRTHELQDISALEAEWAARENRIAKFVKRMDEMSLIIETIKEEHPELKRWIESISKI